jgi:integrase/recombinase XerD
MKTSNSPEGRFAKLVEEFFLDRLIRQRNSSPQTVAAYRDCFRLLFEFARAASRALRLRMELFRSFSR